MKHLDVLIESVETRKPISFEYKIPGESFDKKIGNVHAIYTLTNNLGEEITEMHIYQTDGGFDNSAEKLSARFRAINVQEITNVEILNDEPAFKVCKYYRSEWDGYCNSVVKV